MVHGGIGRAVDASLSARLQAGVSAGVRVMEGVVPEAARRARGATKDAHTEYHVCACQQTQRWDELLQFCINRHIKHKEKAFWDFLFVSVVMIQDGFFNIFKAVECLTESVVSSNRTSG